MNRVSILLVSLLVFSLSAFGQTSSLQAHQSYIETYKVLAIDQMQRYRIPASITLAQGLLESDAGRSYLAVNANNHFGIKASGDWTGPWIPRADDKPDDRFRQYGTVEESYEDHSLFLLRNQRYAPLFKLSLYDYRGWAKTIKQCGYATSAAYANSLIEIIERYNLAEYDHMTLSAPYLPGAPAASLTNVATMSSADLFFQQHPIYRCNGNYYFVVQQGDNLEGISKNIGVRKRKLRRWNELPKGYQLSAGDIVYLGAKKKRADKSMKGVAHVVQPGESLYMISQRYGVKLESIYRINALPADFQPVPGDCLRVY